MTYLIFARSFLVYSPLRERKQGKILEWGFHVILYLICYFAISLTILNNTRFCLTLAILLILKLRIGKGEIDPNHTSSTIPATCSCSLSLSLSLSVSVTYSVSSPVYHLLFFSLSLSLKIKTVNRPVVDLSRYMYIDHIDLQTLTFWLVDVHRSNKRKRKVLSMHSSMPLSQTSCMCEHHIQFTYFLSQSRKAYPLLYSEFRSGHKGGKLPPPPWAWSFVSVVLFFLEFWSFFLSFDPFSSELFRIPKNAFFLKKLPPPLGWNPVAAP